LPKIGNLGDLWEFYGDLGLSSSKADETAIVIGFGPSPFPVCGCAAAQPTIPSAAPELSISAYASSNSFGDLQSAEKVATASFLALLRLLQLLPASYLVI
jgi:hypothetical protein